jgi:carbon-monoxide dehydrogenase small subunit
MDDTRPIHLTVNGQTRHCTVAPRQHLVDFLREDLGLTGSHLGCEHGVCGACTVRLDGQVVRGCLVLAVQADGRSVETVEGLTEGGRMRDLQDAFVARNALQCGYCTPGMLMAAAELIELHPDATREQVRAWMSGNYCRCTGYQAIVDAVCDVLAKRLAAGTAAGTQGAGA